MDHQDVKKYLLQALNMALTESADGDDSYNHSFSVTVDDNGFRFIPNMPAAFIVGNDLYQRIFKIANASLYPIYTVLKQNGAYFVSTNSGDIHNARALQYNWMKGVPERLYINSLSDFAVANSNKKRIPLMKNYSINMDSLTSIAIAGNSGSGKSYLLTYLLSMLKRLSKLVIVDPKFDSPSRWARDNGIEVIHPSDNRSKSDFVSQVNEALSQALETINARQKILYKTTNYQFKHLTITIDEVLALTEGVNKKIKDAFSSLISQIALLGRATRVHLLLVSQRFDYNTIPVSVREQVNVLIQVGNINQKTTQFLFPDLNSDGIVIPIGKGTGLIQVVDDNHPYQVLPFLAPTYTKEKFYEC